MNMKQWFRLPSSWFLIFWIFILIQLSVLSSCMEDESVIKTQPSSEILFLEKVAKGDLLAARELLDRGVSIHVKDSLGNSALIKACDAEDKEMVEMLLSKGANSNQRNLAGETALYRAVFRGNLPLVQILSKSGAEIHVKTVSGESLYELAEERGEDAILEYLNALKKSK